MFTNLILYKLKQHILIYSINSSILKEKRNANAKIFRKTIRKLQFLLKINFLIRSMFILSFMAFFFVFTDFVTTPYVAQKTKHNIIMRLKNKLTFSIYCLVRLSIKKGI